MAIPPYNPYKVPEDLHAKEILKRVNRAHNRYEYDVYKEKYHEYMKVLEKRIYEDLDVNLWNNNPTADAVWYGTTTDGTSTVDMKSQSIKSLMEDTIEFNQSQGKEIEMTKATDLDRVLLTMQAEKGMKTVQVSFYRDRNDGEDGRTYTFKCNINVKKGDLVLVQANYVNNEFGHSIGRVTEINKFVDVTTEFRLSWILCNLTPVIKQYKDAIDGEDEFMRNLANAKVMKEAKELAQEAGVDVSSVKALPNGNSEVIEDGEEEADDK